VELVMAEMVKLGWDREKLCWFIWFLWIRFW
jgi:hypothetical protein